MPAILSESLSLTASRDRLQKDAHMRLEFLQRHAARNRGPAPRPVRQAQRRTGATGATTAAGAGAGGLLWLDPDPLQPLADGVHGPDEFIERQLGHHELFIEFIAGHGGYRQDVWSARISFLLPCLYRVKETPLTTLR